MPNGRQTGAHRQRIAGQRAGLVDGSAGRDVTHDVAPAAIGGDREPAADHFAQRGEVGLDVVELLSAAGRHAEAGHHLVEDQQRIVCRR